MSINISNSNLATFKMKPKQDEKAPSDGSTLEIYEHHEKAPAKVRAGVILTTLAGVSIAMLRTFKKNSKPLKVNNIKDFFKNFAKIEYDKDAHDLEWTVGRLAIGSVGGGLLGGMLFDKKENYKAKIRESVIQLVGNIGVPLTCVVGGMKLFDDHLKPKFDKYFVSKGMDIKKSKLAKSPSAFATVACLVAGIFAGNKIGNAINKYVFNCNEKRTIKLSDMSPHIDDLGIAATFVVPAEDPCGKIIARFVPAALTVAGYSTGIAQEKEKHEHKKPKDIA